jgi:hypothetical protein
MDTSILMVESYQNQTIWKRSTKGWNEGKITDEKCVEGDIPFNNLAPLTVGELTAAKPDLYEGARPEQLDRRVRNELSSYIIPSKQDNLPLVPNFFLEAKGPDGTAAVARRQACYSGALGARGMHSLHSYREDEPVYDNNAYTMTSIYSDGQLKMYTSHLIRPTSPGGQPEYCMTIIHEVQPGAWWSWPSERSMPTNERNAFLLKASC